MRPEDGKKIYDSIEIPDELSDVVNRAIASENKEEIRKKSVKKRRKNTVVRIFRYAAAAAAGLLICLTIGLNTSEAFAKEMSGVPVLGALVRVLTIRSYYGKEGDLEINMEVPEIRKETAENAETITSDTPAADSFTGDINAEIQKIVEDYMAQAKIEFEEYKEAFFATGGTKEEWADRTMDVTVDYDVKYQEGDILSLELLTAKGWVAYQEERYYYNLDLSTGRYLTLPELLGDNYINLCNESVDSQIRKRLAADDSLAYFGYGEMASEDREMGIEGFTTITEDTDYYINEDGNVVIVFPKYEIAPGYMGAQEFVIAK